MEYNKKEQLLDIISGFKFVKPNTNESWFNKGVSEVYERTEKFFDSELIPEVSQYVADWYEENKEVLDYSIWNVIYSNAKGNELDEKLNNWIENTEDAIITLVKMHLFGYKVNKEKRYKVRLKNKSGNKDYLVKTSDNSLRFYNNIYTENMAHTRKELEEAGFDWVFDCEGIEIEEVD